ncbi:MAG: hypothetical protein LUF85_11225, partial [Bacteroides sp.]|nr:hypothetical protein [Bacteroides sp.]
MNQLKERLKKIDDYFPRIANLLLYVDYCQNLGLNKEQARQIVNGQTVIYDGSLYYRHESITCHVKGAHLKLLVDKQNNFHLTING